MSGAAPPLPGGWASAQDLDGDARRNFYEQGKALDQEIRANRRAIRLGGYAVGVAGLLIGVAGIAAAAAMLPLKHTEIRFVPFDLASQQVVPSVLAKDAPDTLFREQQAKADLRKLVAAAETYVPDMFALNFHQVAVMSDPAMQARFAEELSPKSPRSPAAKYRNQTSVVVDKFQYWPLGKSGNAQVWRVTFQRTEIVGGTQLATRPYEAVVTFVWRPDLATVSEDDRALNLTGFQCLDYRSGDT